MTLYSSVSCVRGRTRERMKVSNQARKKRVKCVWTLQEAVNTTRSHVSVTICFKFAWWNAVLEITELHYYGITINCIKDYMMNRLKDQHHSASIIVSLMLNIGEVCKIKTCRRAFKNVELFATQHRGNSEMLMQGTVRVLWKHTEWRHAVSMSPLDCDQKTS